MGSNDSKESTNAITKSQIKKTLRVFFEEVSNFLYQIDMKVGKLRLIGNDNVKLHTNPDTGEEEMYVSEDIVPQKVFSMALRVIGSRNGYMFCKAGSWNYFFPDNRGGLRRVLRKCLIRA